MAILYRSEKKKIIENQISLINQVRVTLDTKILLAEEKEFSRSFTEVVMAMSEGEASKSKDGTPKAEEAFWYRRLINAGYYRQIKDLMMEDGV